MKAFVKVFVKVISSRFFWFSFCYYCYYLYDAFILDQEIMSQISEIEEILRNEKLPDYLKTSAESAKGITKFFYQVI